MSVPVAVPGQVYTSKQVITAGPGPSGLCLDRTKSGLIQVSVVEGPNPVVDRADLAQHVQSQVQSPYANEHLKRQ